MTTLKWGMGQLKALNYWEDIAGKNYLSQFNHLGDPCGYSFTRLPLTTRKAFLRRTLLLVCTSTSIASCFDIVTSSKFKAVVWISVCVLLVPASFCSPNMLWSVQLATNAFQTISCFSKIAFSAKNGLIITKWCYFSAKKGCSSPLRKIGDVDLVKSSEILRI